MLKYIPVEEKHHAEELGSYTSFGIRVLKTEDNRQVELAYITDISVCYSEIQQLASRCTEGQLSPIHIFDAIDDFFVEMHNSKIVG